MSLEQQLIRGAGQAVSKDPYGIVMQAQERASQKLTEGVKGIAAKIGDIKKRRDDLSKSYDDSWESIANQYIDDGGLPMEAWENATEQSKKFKAKHDACPIGKEGDMCRKKATMELRAMAGGYTGANNKLSSIVDTDKKIKGTYVNPDTGKKVKLDQSNYDLDSLDGMERKAIRAGLSPGNYSEKMKDDKLQIGWDVPGYGFISQDDDRLDNLYTFKANDVKLHILDRKKGGEQSEYKGWDMADSIYANKGIITEGNIASIYHDEVTGPGGILKERLKEHPLLKGKSYKKLGIDRVGGDDVIDDDEIESVIQALADPKHPNFKFEVSQAIAAEYMAMNEDIERQKYLRLNETDTPTETDETKTGETETKLNFGNTSSKK